MTIGAVVVDWVTSLALVGRKGADAVAVGTVAVTVQELLGMVFVPDAGGHVLPIAQARSFGQQPPPRLIGQAWNPHAHANVVCRAVFVPLAVRLEVLDVVVGRTVEVTTTSTVVEDEDMPCDKVDMTVTAGGTPRDMLAHARSLRQNNTLTSYTSTIVARDTASSSYIARTRCVARGACDRTCTVCSAGATTHTSQARISYGETGLSSRATQIRRCYVGACRSTSRTLKVSLFQDRQSSRGTSTSSCTSAAA